MCTYPPPPPPPLPPPQNTHQRLALNEPILDHEVSPMNDNRSRGVTHK